MPRTLLCSLAIAALEPIAGCAAYVVPDNCMTDAPDVIDVASHPDVLTPPPGVCVLSSGRDCRFRCLCDDGCNSCSCTNVGDSWSILETEQYCSEPPAGTRTCTTGIDHRCVRARSGDTSCNVDPALREMYYCPPSCSDSCPRAGCRLVSTVSDSNDSLWCCP